MDSALVNAIMKTLGSGGSVTHFAGFPPAQAKGLPARGFPPAEAKGLPPKRARPPVRPPHVREPRIEPLPNYVPGKKPVAKTLPYKKGIPLKVRNL